MDLIEHILIQLNEILAKYNTTTEPISEIEIFHELASLRGNDSQDDPFEYIAETLAFELKEGPFDDAMGWGTYYGPTFYQSFDDGTIIKIPDLPQITPDIISYWEQQAKLAINSIMRSRYADLVWDLSFVAASKKPDFTMAHIAIDSILEIADQNAHSYQMNVVKKLKRALSIALSLNDNAQIEKVRDAIIAYEDLVGEDDKPGLWGYSYDLLYNNKKINLTPEQKTKIISDLENRFKRIITSPTPDPWLLDHAASRLADYYNNAGQREDMNRVISGLGSIFEGISQDAAPLLGISMLEHLHPIYMKYGLKDKATDATRKIRELGPKMKEQMKVQTHNIEISQKEIEDYIASTVEGDLHSVLIKIAVNFTPQRDQIIELLKDLSRDAPLTFHISTHIQDHQGRPIATIGPLEDDLNGNIVYQASKNLSFSAYFLNEVMNATVSKFNLAAEQLTDYLYQSPVFDKTRRDIIEQGIGLYFAGENFLAIHILVPQIEHLLRNLLEICGGYILKSSRTGGFDFRTLDDILHDPIFEKLFGQDIVLYFLTLLTDKRGWNIRNRVCHGLATGETLGKSVADRLLHVLLVLALINETQPGI